MSSSPEHANANATATRRDEERPSQIKFVRPAQMSLFANVRSWPPLGQVTVLNREKGDGKNSKDTVRCVYASALSTRLFT